MTNEMRVIRGHQFTNSGLTFIASISITHLQIELIEEVLQISQYS